MRTMTAKQIRWNRMVAMLGLLAISILSACQPDAATAAESGSPEAENRSAFAGLLESWTEQTYEVPKGTELTIRLTHALNSGTNQPGDRFEGVVDEPVHVDQVLVIPQGARVEGVLTEVKESGKVKGVAEMRLDLRTLEVDGKSYDLAVHPLTFRASKSTKKDAAVIAGSSAVGALIGAIAGGGKGAAVGAGVGGGAGTGYVLMTEGEQVRLRAEQRIRFELTDSVELPEHRGAH